MSNTHLPPRFVPTLTDVVQPDVLRPEPSMSIHQNSTAQVSRSEQTSSFNTSHTQSASITPPLMTLETQLKLENEILSRVMQRVDTVLEASLQEAVSEIVFAHTQTLTPRLREEIELVVRDAVMQAVSQELYRKAD
jgi:hypothetical protein